MSRLSSIHPENAAGLTAELFAKIKKAAGRVPNAYATVGSHSPAALAAILGADAALAAGSLNKSDVEAIKLAVSEIGGCDYCVAAHTQIGKFAGLSGEAMKQVRAGLASGNAQRDALVRFVRAIVNSRGTVPEAEVAAVRAGGYSEQQVIEAILAVSVITFTNLVNRVNDTEIDFPAVA
ncbi:MULTISPECIES: carboxymuconolactone decarboxylase family protein [unclassified Variovorax]|uniref:carboxymuconolactone decarboxylase family protein n=1 Tax=unclassified Variovorax TaxID=663243 RepID=UPI00076CD34C|nr:MULTISPECIES: carboxymuconolactone decarboxylase family protein [unclassified Variovorax]KWT68566.1 Macrophage infectivity potentiator-related protein [Variovorax sp. WDL1]PNG46684.1 Alkyl hydroperoxide reductase AhpD [Variovorax sp. B2]PNG48665.1 Alkyl hydroperoxide reductase AhpD [Variovorax sp. B4]VTV14472.1 putative peroxidase-related enzyme [Variovorax sp. WDL1]